MRRTCHPLLVIIALNVAPIGWTDEPVLQVASESSAPSAVWAALE